LISSAVSILTAIPLRDCGGYNQAEIAIAFAFILSQGCDMVDLVNAVGKPLRENLEKGVMEVLSEYDKSTES
jgi:hypothetical protein